MSCREDASSNARSGANDDVVIALGLSVGIEPHGARMTVTAYLDPTPTLEQWDAGANTPAEGLQRCAKQ